MKMMRFSKLFRFVGCWGLVFLVCGCGEHRPVPTESRLIQDEQSYNRHAAGEFQTAMEHIVRRIERKDSESAAHTPAEPTTMHVLILSGGGDYGAFGAGFLKGWGAITDPAHARPQFDVVTGVSTGSLIAPFAFIGTDSAYDQVLNIYKNPKENWAVLRGPLFFLPGNPSMLDVKGLDDEIRQQINDDIIRKIADGGREDRILGVASTNLDFKEQRIWVLTAEAAEVKKAEDAERFRQILLSSCSIPGAFPPRIIDGVLYVDGGCVSNILYNPDMMAPDSAMGIWRRKFPDRPLPRQRIWVIINEQLHPPPGIVQPTWVSVAGAAVSQMIRASTHTSLRQLANQASVVRATEGADIEVRFIAIPDDWRAPDTSNAAFDKPTMDSLAALGQKLGADPNSWKIVAGPGSLDRLSAEGAAPAR